MSLTIDQLQLSNNPRKKMYVCIFLFLQSGSDLLLIFQKIRVMSYDLPPKKTRPKHQSKLYRAVKNPKNTTGTLTNNVNPHTNGSAFGMVCLKICEAYDPKGTPEKYFITFFRMPCRLLQKNSHVLT